MLKWKPSVPNDHLYLLNITLIRKKLLDCSSYSEPFFFKLCFKWLDKGPKVKEFLVCYRHPNTACEVLTADVYAIIDKLTNNEVLVLS